MKRRPAVTRKVIEGLHAVSCSAGPSLECFQSDEVRDREHERQMVRGLTYISDLHIWWLHQQDKKKGAQ